MTSIKEQKKRLEVKRYGYLLQPGDIVLFKKSRNSQILAANIFSPHGVF